MLDEKFAKYSAFFHNLELKRELWKSNVKPNLIIQLENYAKKFKNGLFVQVNDSIINHEGVFLAFGKVRSGHYYNEGDFFNQNVGRKGWISMDPGCLAFSFSYNGKVLVWMQYPQIESIVSEAEYQDFGVLEVDQLSAEKIEIVIEWFLENLIEWWKDERGKDEYQRFRRIGYFPSGEAGSQ